jgi:hypothetical protein
MSVAMEYNVNNPTGDHITIPYMADEAMIASLVDEKIPSGK